MKGRALRFLSVFAFGLLLGCVVLLDVPCVIRSRLGILCPTCGMSRAWLAVFRLELASAFSYHPMFWAVPLSVGLWAWYGDRQPRWSLWLLTGLLVLFVLVYFLRLSGVLGAI